MASRWCPSCQLSEWITTKFVYVIPAWEYITLTVRWKTKYIHTYIHNNNGARNAFYPFQWWAVIKFIVSILAMTEIFHDSFFFHWFSFSMNSSTCSKFFSKGTIAGDWEYQSLTQWKIKLCHQHQSVFPLTLAAELRIRQVNNSKTSTCP